MPAPGDIPTFNSFPVAKACFRARPPHSRFRHCTISEPMQLIQGGVVRSGYMPRSQCNGSGHRRFLERCPISPQLSLRRRTGWRIRAPAVCTSCLRSDCRIQKQFRRLRLRLFQRSNPLTAMAPQSVLPHCIRAEIRTDARTEMTDRPSRPRSNAGNSQQRSSPCKTASRTASSSIRNGVTPISRNCAETIQMLEPIAAGSKTPGSCAAPNVDQLMLVRRRLKCAMRR